MADEQIEEEEGGGKKGGLVKIIMLVVGVVLVVLLTIGLTLYFTDFDPGAEEVAEEQISALETEAAAAAEEVAQQPAKIQLEARRLRNLRLFNMNSNVNSSPMSYLAKDADKLVIMTHYDEQVISNIEKHIRYSLVDTGHHATGNRARCCPRGFPDQHG